MNLKLFDHVRLKVPIPEQALKAGQEGAIVMLHEMPSEAYEVEFCDDAGATVAQVTLTEDQIEKVNY